MSQTLFLQTGRIWLESFEINVKTMGVDDSIGGNPMHRPSIDLDLVVNRRENALHLSNVAV